MEAKYKYVIADVFDALTPLFAFNSKSVPAFIMADEEAKYIGSLRSRAVEAVVFELGEKFVLGYLDDAQQLEWEDALEIRKTHPPRELRAILEPCLIALKTGQEVEHVIRDLHGDVETKARKHFVSLAASPYKAMFKSLFDTAVGLVIGKTGGVAVGAYKMHKSLSKRQELMPVTFSKTLEEIREQQTPSKEQQRGQAAHFGHLGVPLPCDEDVVKLTGKCAAITFHRTSGTGNRRPHGDRSVAEQSIILRAHEVAAISKQVTDATM